MTVTVRTLESTETTTDAADVTVEVTARDPQTHKEAKTLAQEAIEAAIDAGGRVPETVRVSHDAGNTSLVVFAPLDAADRVADALRETAREHDAYRVRQVDANDETPADLEAADDDNDDLYAVLKDAASSDCLHDVYDGDLDDRLNAVSENSRLSASARYLARHPADAWDHVAVILDATR
jgi:hypothetical protein